MSHSKKKPNKEKFSNQQNQIVPSDTLVETDNEVTSQKSSTFLLAFLPALVTFFISLGAYLLTFARTVTLVDSGELILTSAKLGVAHPPGFPLYTILGYIFSKLPFFGTPAAKMSFMSAVFAALASAVLTLIVINIYDGFTELSPSNKKPNVKKSTINHLVLSPIFRQLLPIAIGLCFAFSSTFWFYASVAEVYTLNIFVLSVIIYLMLEWHLFNKKGDLINANRIIPIAALVYGLALGVHHVTILLTLPAIAFLVVHTAGFNYLLSRPVKIAFITVLIGFAIYIYLPIAASQAPILNWGNPDSLEKFYWHISAKQYRVNLSLNSETIIPEFKYFFKLVFWQFTPLGLIAALIGLEAFWRRQRSIFYLISLIILFDVAYSVSYEIAEDKDAYYLTTNFALAIAISGAMLQLFEKLAEKGKPFAIALLIFLVLLPVLNFTNHYSQNNKRNYLIARDFVENTMANVEPNGLLLTLEWQFYSPYLYMRHLENFRRDAIVVDVNLLRRSWYIDGYLKREYPDMMAACAKETSEFMAYLTLFEEDKPYDVNNINKTFSALINAFIKYNISKHAVYTTLPIDPPDIGKEYNWVPQGLTMRFYQDQVFHPDPTQPLQLRGLLDNSVHLDEVAEEKILPVYALMLSNRAKYLSLGQKYDEAIELLQLSLKLKPDFDRAYQFLGDVYVGKGNKVEAELNYQLALQINPTNQAVRNALQQLRATTPPQPQP